MLRMSVLAALDGFTLKTPRAILEPKLLITLGKLLQTSRFYKQINSFNTPLCRFIQAFSILLHTDTAF